jgi:hypothetical protein
MCSTIVASIIDRTGEFLKWCETEESFSKLRVGSGCILLLSQFGELWSEVLSARLRR